MKILITGGAGFIGINAAKTLLDNGNEIIIFDNLFRKGAKENLEWLRKNGKFEFIKGDIRNFKQVKSCFLSHKGIDVILHLAAQVAVTTSVLNPREDFEINALGTFNICEAVRKFQPQANLLYASTNKVYGAMDDLEIIEENGKYKYKDLPNGVSENRPLDFYSPYGCSKGAGDQYVRDYARIYRLKTVNFRQSCIYGPRQFGIEDQGWVAWFTICAVLGKSFTIYGDGKQVRDILFVGDLIDCYLKAIESIDRIRGRIYNIGGGPENALSLLQLISFLEEFLGKKIQYKFADWRPGDQKIFVCDTKKAEKDFNWKPRTKVKEGIERLFRWVLENRSLFKYLTK